MDVITRRFVVGLTGGIGSGKSTAADMFRCLGAEVIDADVIAREVVRPGSDALEAIRRRFGDGVIAADGTLRRAELRRLVFAGLEREQSPPTSSTAGEALVSLAPPQGGSDKAARAAKESREWLESLLHPLIRDSIEERLNSPISAPYYMLVVPLLLETGRHPSVQRVVVVDLPPAEQLRRSCVRDDSDPAVIKAIIAAQTGRDKRLLAADDILDNSGSLDNLRQQVEGLHRLYLKIANANNE